MLMVPPVSMASMSMPSSALCSPHQQPARGHIFGRIQLSLLYSINDGQLVVTVLQVGDGRAVSVSAYEQAVVGSNHELEILVGFGHCRIFSDIQSKIVIVLRFY